MLVEYFIIQLSFIVPSRLNILDMDGLQEIYLKRSTQFSEKAEQLKRQYVQWSLIRLVLFIVGIGVIIYVWTTFGWMVGVSLLVLTLLAFAAFIRRHQKVQEAQLHNERLAAINEKEAAVFNGDYQKFEDGAAFSNPLHPYGIDLDIFGPYSIFQFLNRTTTSYGKARLANYLSERSDSEEIKARQAAIAELKPQLDWRQNLQALGMVTEEEHTHLKALKTWLSEAPIVRGNKLTHCPLIHCSCAWNSRDHFVGDVFPGRLACLALGTSRLSAKAYDPAGK